MLVHTLPLAVDQQPGCSLPVDAHSPITLAKRINLFQIAYSPESLANVESGYQVLDNLSNQRPDWYEYWPIRNYLLTEPLDEQAFYGFFSTKFQTKTGLSYADVFDFVQQQVETVDIVLFSPQPDMGAFFINVFEQGEAFDPGFTDAFNSYLLHVGVDVSITSIVMDARHIVFSNFFVAKPAFWRAWLATAEAMFAICEGPSCVLKNKMCVETTYPGAAQRKIFLIERIASFLLSIQPQWRSVTYNPFNTAWSMFGFRLQPHQAYVSDALKLAFNQHRYPQYLEAYSAIRERFKSLGAKNA